MATRLHQIIAVERTVTAETQRRLSEIAHVMGVGGDQDPLTGIARTYRPAAEDGVVLPPEFRKVQVTAAELTGMAREVLVRLFDLKYTREFANTEAKADVVIEGQTILSEVPAGYLLFLESQISDLISRLIDKIPTLDPAEEWHTDPALPVGVWKTTPRERTRSEQVPHVQVLYPATPEHPAQVRPYEVQQVVGYWEQVKMSGQMPASMVEELRGRATRLLEAVRYAREGANTLEVVSQRGGEAVLGYIFGDVGSG